MSRARVFQAFAPLGVYRAFVWAFDALLNEARPFDEKKSQD
jgi:hypothetical protein